MLATVMLPKFSMVLTTAAGFRAFCPGLKQDRRGLVAHQCHVAALDRPCRASNICAGIGAASPPNVLKSWTPSSVM